MNSDLPKVLHLLAGRSMIGHVAAAVAPLAPAPLLLSIDPVTITRRLWCRAPMAPNRR